MNPEYYEQMQQLQQARWSFMQQGSSNAGRFVTQDDEVEKEKIQEPGQLQIKMKPQDGSSLLAEPVHDPMMYPGLYAPSGFDMMGILVRVRTRPNPVIDIGNIDSSVALILVDSALPDMPIVYCSEPFLDLTGYKENEILGRNCRFLQLHYQAQQPISKGMVPVQDAGRYDMNAEARAQLKQAFARGLEARVHLVNYRKSGEMFENILTTIPIAWDENKGEGKRYVVGFQADSRGLFRFSAR